MRKIVVAIFCALVVVHGVDDVQHGDGVQDGEQGALLQTTKVGGHYGGGPPGHYGDHSGHSGDGPPNQRHYDQARAAGAEVAAGLALLAPRHEKANQSFITTKMLHAAENKFTHEIGKVGFAAHGDVGGDRMSFNGYAPIYEEFLPTVSTVASPTIAEVGILGCSGVAMWKELFPSSKVFGFDINTTTCRANFGTLKDRGFNDSLVQIVTMDQEADNRVLLRKVLYSQDLLNIVIDDGYHNPEVNINTFIQMKPFLADKFLYIIEDVYPEHVENEVEWAGLWAQLVQACPATECSLHLRKGASYVVVLHHLPHAA